MIDIHNTDCLPELKKMKPNEFDLAIVDVPYGIKDRMQGTKQFGQQSKNADWNKETPTKEYYDELLRVSKNQIIFGANYFANCLPNARDWLVWDKKQGDLNFSMHELAWTSFDRVPKILRHFTLRGGNVERIHPCQKPVKLYEDILLRYAVEGDTILDTHLGSGSIAIACHNLNFSLRAYELNRDYYEAAVERINKHTQQKRFF